MMANTLGLDDDLDPVEVVIDIEKAFNIKITDNEAIAILTVGQMYDLLLKNISLSAANRKCASAMAFYRLRRAVADLRAGEKLAPASDLSFLEYGRTKRNWKRLESASGLRLPPLDTARKWPFWIALLIAVAAVPMILTGLILVFFSLELGDQLVSLAPALLFGGFVLALVAGAIDRGKLPNDCRTLAGLANKAAARNYGRLILSGAAVNQTQIWQVMVEVFSDLSSLPAEEITRETYFLHATWEKAKAA